MRLKKQTVALLGLFLAIIGCGQEQVEEKQMKASMRSIGHEILEFNGDSSTRILPIKRKGNQYQIQFESDFRLNPTGVVVKVDEVMRRDSISTNYFVEVEACETGEIVHSYGVEGILQPMEVACGTRRYAESCYVINITLLDQKQESGNLLIVVLLMILVCLVGFLLYKRWQLKSPGSNPNLIHIGRYRFDQRNLKLFIEKIEVELTGKEADLLVVLYRSANETLERDYILNQVWGDEGDYVGRTLDVFISKLRKKLEADPSVKIVNVRGVGYRLVLNDLE